MVGKSAETILELFFKVFFFKINLKNVLFADEKLNSQEKIFWVRSQDF